MSSVFSHNISWLSRVSATSHVEHDLLPREKADVWNIGADQGAYPDGTWIGFIVLRAAELIGARIRLRVTATRSRVGVVRASASTSTLKGRPQGGPLQGCLEAPLWERASRAKLSQGCSPAGRLPQKHGMAPAGNTVAPMGEGSKRFCGSAPCARSFREVVRRQAGSHKCQGCSPAGSVRDRHAAVRNNAPSLLCGPRHRRLAA